MDIIINIIVLYISISIVIFLHELGHIPETIKWKWGIIPHAAAMRARSRIGGLVANALIFFYVFRYQPQMFLLQVVGLVAWVHFLLYTTLGSIMPEPNEKQVNIKTYVFDDVDNKYAIAFWAVAVFIFIYMKDYYFPIIERLIG